MTWRVIQLEPGPAWPSEATWPHGIEAYVPFPGTFENAEAPATDKVLLFAKNSDDSARKPLVWLGTQGAIITPIRLEKWLPHLLQETYREEHKEPLSAKLPFHYHHVPGFLRNLIAAVLLRKNSKSKDVPKFPISPLNAGTEILLSSVGYSEIPKLSQATLVLTHDVDTAQGLKLVPQIADTEEKYGFRSSWNIVPRRYSLPHSLLHEIKNRGFEIGLHGIWHTNRECFLPEGRLDKELADVRPLIDEFQMKGYRSPSWFRNASLYKSLAKYFTYDSSTLDSDTLCPGGPGGVGLMRPFWIATGLLELPCTLPFEAPVFFGTAPEDLIQYWMPKIEFIQKSGGLLLINTHPDPTYLGNKRLNTAYTELLRKLSEMKWHSQLPHSLRESLRA